jgi:hypothetical protein
MNRHWLLILLFLFATSFVRAQQDSKIAPADSLPVYQGVGVKLDVAMPIIEVARSAGKIQTYELAVNVRLLNRFYPVLETGYAIAQCGADGGNHKGHGGFARVGMDMAVIKKGVAENNVLVGLRFGNAFQRYDLTNVQVQTDYWPSDPLDFYNQFRYDCWGEIVAGCQVFVWKGLHLGWTGRMKFLMTRNAKPGKVMPYYVPGLGFRKDFNWGFNYYIGYRF